MLRTVTIDLFRDEPKQSPPSSSVASDKEQVSIEFKRMESLDAEEKLPCVVKRRKEGDGTEPEHVDNVELDTLKKPDKKKASASHDTAESKPRIVLTFRTEKPGVKTSNMKIVSTEECPRRSTKCRGGDSDAHDEEPNDSSVSPQKGKAHSESDEHTSDSAATAKRSSRRRSKEFSESILENAIARKEKSYNEATPSAGPTQRLSRRIKPTAKILANKELRIGLETQNNARLGITPADKAEDGGIQTRRSKRRRSAEHNSSEEKIPLLQPTQSSKGLVVKRNARGANEQEDKGSQENYNKLKKKHLSTLGLKEVDAQGQGLDDTPYSNIETSSKKQTTCSVMDENEVEELLEEEEEMLEDGSDLQEYQSHSSECSDEYIMESGEREIPTGAVRRSPRKNRSEKVNSNVRSSSYRKRRQRDTSENMEEENISEEEQSDSSFNETDDDVKKHHGESMEYEDDTEDQNRVAPRRSTRKKNSQSGYAQFDEWPGLVQETSEHSEPASGDEGSVATCPEDEAASIATCYCEAPSNIYVTPSDLKESVFCRAVETADGVRVGCSHAARRGPRGGFGALLRAGPRTSYLLMCRLHARQLRAHMCCPACGLFCSQGTFYQCSEGHLFHLECGLPYGEGKIPPGCPHCGLSAYRWMPRNTNCYKVKVQMKCSNKRTLLPDQREQCTQAYLSFSKLDETKLELESIIPEDLLPCSPIDLKSLCNRADNTDYEELLSTSASERLYEAIVNKAKTEALIPKIMCGVDVNGALEAAEGGSYLHTAARAGHLSAVYLLHYAGARLDLADRTMHTPLLRAVQALVGNLEETKKSDKTDKKIKSKRTKENQDVQENDVKAMAEDENKEDKVKCKKEINTVDEELKNEADLLKVIRYLVAAGCDVNFPGPEGSTALHVAAARGHVDACTALLAARGALVDVRDASGWTPLVWAAENGHHHVVRLLLSRGADAGTMDAEGNGALHWCTLGGHTAALRLLLDAAPPQALDSLNSHGDTPLHVAAQLGLYPCVVVLLARGARTDIENAEGSLAVEVCSGECQTAISLNMQITIATKDTPNKPQRLVSRDISNGRERYPIPCVNDVDEEGVPDDFVYVTRHVMPELIQIDNTIATMQGCDCKGTDCSASSCACSVLSVKRWYANGRLLPNFPFHEPPMLFECNYTCGCTPTTCGNSAVSLLSSRGATFPRAQVYRVGGAAGWGLRAGERVSRGQPVAIYCGELLPAVTADTRAADQYMFSLDLKPDLIEQCADKTQLCVDAARYGSAARFVNHSCRPNLAPVRVFTGTRDLRLPDIVLFAVRDIAPMEEFTFDYGDKFWSVKSKRMRCVCDAPDCRYPTKASEDEAEDG